MKKSPLPHVVNVFRDKLVICTALHPEPLVFKFTSSMVSDLDVINHQELDSSLKTFIDTNKLKPVNLVIILNSSVYFEKDYAGLNLPASQDMEDFIDTIPFSATSSKLFRSSGGYKQIVINRDLYESLKKSFESLGYSVSAVVPGFALGPTDAHQEVTAETCRIIYKKMDQITADSFTSLSDSSASFKQKEQFFLRKYKTLVIIISILSIIAAVVVVPFTLRKPSAPKKTVPVPVQIKPSVIPTIIPEITSVAATPSVELLKTFTAQILNGSGRTGQAASLSARLTSVGFSQIQTGNNSQVTPKTIMIFSPKIATSAGEFVTNLVRELYPDVTTTTNIEADFDLTVIIGKSTP